MAQGGLSSAGLGRLHDVMARHIERGTVPGVVTLVSRRGEVHVDAIGSLATDSRAPMQRDTIFRIASMTKPIAATALMMLVAEGKVKIEDPVSKYLPSFANLKFKDGTPAPAITIQQILTHTAGLSPTPAADAKRDTLAELTDALAKMPLQFEPGSKWQYSSGITVAGRIVEVVSGEEFSAFLQRRIFDPLDMRDTTFRLSSEQAVRLAELYMPDGQGGLKPAPSVDPTIARLPSPSGGLYSTAGDMAKFYQAILNGEVGEKKLRLSGDQIKTMTTAVTGDLQAGFTPGSAWALGWATVTRPQGVTRLVSPRTFGHGGAFGTQGWIDPQRRIILVLMIQRTGLGNSDGSDVRDAFTELAITAYRGQPSTEKGASSKFIDFHNYRGAVELTNGDARVVLCPQVGGRVLEFSLDGKNSLYLDEREKNWQPGQPPSVSAGRFDVGPELTVTPHPQLWSGPWTAEITGSDSARLTSVRDEPSGMQLVRDFKLRRYDIKEEHVAYLNCEQTIMNIGQGMIDVCHWGRSFSPGGGICLVPLSGNSRFPSKYAMYEDSAIINVKPVDERIRERDGVLEILGPPRKPKLGFDSEAGWLAYVMPDNRLFYKRFPVYEDATYNEAAGLTLSVWYPEGPRIELEPIGPREKLARGEVATYYESWYLTEFPYPKSGEKIDLEQLNKLVNRRYN